MKGCVDTAIKIHEKEPPGDVLIFLTGMEEVDHCSNLLKNYSDTARDSKHGEDLTVMFTQGYNDVTEGLKMWISPMYGALAPAKQLKALRPAGKGDTLSLSFVQCKQTSRQATERLLLLLTLLRQVLPLRG